MQPAALDMLADLWEMVRAAGAFGAAMLFFMWKRADDERLRLQKEKDSLIDQHHKSKDEITERAVAAINNNSLVIQGLKDLLQSGRAHTP